MIVTYKNKGSLTIEASLVLFVFVFAFLFFMSFAKYSAVQNKVKHSLNQTAISMSARNNQLVQLSKILNKAAGLSTEKLAEWVNDFGLDKTVKISNVTPYTSYSADAYKNKTANWSDADMKREILRFFAYYCIDLSFKDSDKMSYEDICKRLDKSGIADVNITGGNTKKFNVDEQNNTLTIGNQFVNGNDLTITITYKIRTGMSFSAIFGFDKELEFTDSVSAKLMK